MNHNPPVTGLNNIIERSRAFIAYLLGKLEQNEHILAGSPIALLPAPRATTAATWERERHVCPICQEEMTRSLFGKDEYFCLPCDQSVADEAKENLAKLQTGRINSITLPPGEIVRRVRAATPGTYVRNMRHAWQEEHVKSIIASMETVDELPPLTPAMRAAFNKPPTTPLVERDIERAPTPQPTQQPTPTTPIPEARADLFADIPQEAPDSEEEEEEDETTEKRPVVRRVTDTIQIPNMRAEAILLDMMHGEISPQSTGETEQLPAKTNAWML